MDDPFICSNVLQYYHLLCFSTCLFFLKKIICDPPWFPILKERKHRYLIKSIDRNKTNKPLGIRTHLANILKNYINRLSSCKERDCSIHQITKRCLGWGINYQKFSTLHAYFPVKCLLNIQMHFFLAKCRFLFPITGNSLSLTCTQSQRENVREGGSEHASSCGG